jgi:AcrR family transcriptional regulator
VTPAPPRRGRRPGGTDTREKILTAARKAFADKGYNRAGVRAIAEDAAVDPALIYHYFGGKKELFLAAMNITLDPEAVTRAILDGPRNEAGFRLVRYVLGFWGSPAGSAALALLRSSMDNDWTVRLMGEFVSTEILRRVIAGLGIDPDETPLRTGLVVSQIMGLAVTRHILKPGALVATDLDTLIAAIGPTVQRYLTDDMPK